MGTSQVGRAATDAVLRQFLLGIAEGLNAAAESVDRIHETMMAVSRVYGADEIDFVILPTVILVDTGESGRVAIRSVATPSFRFDQIAALYELVSLARTAQITPIDGIRRLNEIGAMRPRIGWFVRTLGHAILTTGLALLLAPTWQGAIVAFILGALIGLLKLVRSPTLQLVMPIVAALVCALAVFALAPFVAIGDPLRLLIAPLATFLPGGALTTATGELAAGQMLAGASRLVYGFVQLALLAFGIIAAATLIGVDMSQYDGADSARALPRWVALVGVVLFAVGNYLHFSAPSKTFGWVLLALLVAYGGQTVGALVFGASLSGFIGALAMTPVVLWIASLPHGAPSQLTFLPAFWILVPGAAGLVGLTEAVATDAGVAGLTSTLVTIMSIALGVLIGTAVYRAVHRGAEELARFHIAMPTDPVARERAGFWQRIITLFQRKR